MEDLPEYKFQKLDVYKLALEFVDKIYALTSKLPNTEQFNLCFQVQRAATSVVLNIAEGSTGQSDLEQNRFLGMALPRVIIPAAAVITSLGDFIITLGLMALMMAWYGFFAGLARFNSSAVHRAGFWLPLRLVFGFHR